MNEQTKKLITKIPTWTIVAAAVILAGYFLTKEDTTLPLVDEATKSAAAQTVAVGLEIDRTIKELVDIQGSVASSIAIFDTNKFKELTNFSVLIPAENVGRTNPFIPTPWNLKIQAIEGSATKR